MDFNLTQEQRMIYEYGDRISKQFDHNYWRGYAEKNERPVELYQQITDDGFLGIMVPEAYGGAGPLALRSLNFRPLFNRRASICRSAASTLNGFLRRPQKRQYPQTRPASGST